MSDLKKKLTKKNLISHRRNKIDLILSPYCNLEFVLISKIF